MTRRLLVSYLTVTVLALVILEVPLAIFYSQRERERIAADVEHDAYVLATIYEDDLEQGRPLDPTQMDDYARRTDARVIIVDRNGISQADTDQELNRDYSTRPEFEEALAGRTASGTRRSETLGSGLLYVAVPVASGGTVHGALRVTLDTGEVDARIHRFWWALGGLAAVVLLAVAGVGWAIARSVTAPIRRLHATAARFAAGDLRVGTEPSHGPPEIRELATTLDSMAGRLDELLRQQREFVADASHQLRTPLTALRLRLENLQSELAEAARAVGADDRSDEIAAAIDELDRLGGLVTGLLQLARADEHPTPEPTDLAALAADRVDTWTAVAEAADVRLVADIPPAPVMVSAVHGAVEQILDNLLDNASNASSAGGTVTVRVSTGGELSISDEGPGLTDEQKALATRRFWRGPSTAPGSGLGLAIVDSLAAASGARLTLADSPSGGLQVVVAFLRVGA